VFTLVLYPEAQRRPQAEMVAMVADDRLLTFEDRSSMPYLEVTLQESLRRHSALLAPVGECIYG
ncbi:hypothetical protein PAXINDRAFT_90432, partial [Paxillus involutus ATCC 200175]